jgi:hypothetical protein
LTSTFGSRRTRSKAARFSRRVDLVLRAAVEEVEDRARQPPLREASQIRDIHRPGEVGHKLRVTLP